MNLQEYKEQAAKFAVYDDEHAYDHLTLGLIAEVGELAGLFAKEARGDVTDDLNSKIVSELGDILWYLVMWADREEFTFNNISFSGRDIYGPLGITSAIRDLSKACNQAISTFEHSEIYYALRTFGFVCIAFNRSMEHVADLNIQKLTERQKRGTIRGNNRKDE